MRHLTSPIGRAGGIAALALIALAGCGESREPIGIEEESPPAYSHGAALSHTLLRPLAELARRTAPFHRLDRAAAAGYTAEITPCWQHTSLGAMGYHIGNESLIDGTVTLLEPELLMYEPQRNGRMRLVGMEYIVPVEAWTGEEPPTLLGQTMHRHSTLPIYKLHIWLWKVNPRGVFADWNPLVSCRFADETELFE